MQKMYLRLDRNGTRTRAGRKGRREDAENAGEADERTIELIGEEEFREMSRRIDSIMRRHAGHHGVTLQLTCGPDTKAGADNLHSILPGSPLHLVLCREGGVEWIDVYHCGDRIGRLALNEAALVMQLIKSNEIKAVYVAEQNCYGIEGSHKMIIIIFYVHQQDMDKSRAQSDAKRRLARCDGTRFLEICQN